MRQDSNGLEHGSNDSHSSHAISISLAYAPTPEVMLYEEVEVIDGTTLIEALEQVGWLDIYPELKNWCVNHQEDIKVDNKAWFVGVFSQKKLLSYRLQAHDRVEVYRPLLVDPMGKRKKRATQQ